MKNRFSHLHVHSEYSILKGTSSVEKWYEAAERRNIQAIAFTEWSNMGSAMESFLESRKVIENHEMENVKAIFGLQILVVQELESSVQEDNIILLARNERGYKNLMKLSKFSYTKGFDISRQTARVDFETLDKYSRGIYCLSGSLSGPIAVSLEAGYSIAEEAFLQLREIYGKRLFLEIQMNEFEEQKKLNKVLFSLSKKHKNKCVLTNDCHYVNKDEDKLAWFVSEIFKHSGKYIKRSDSKVGTQKWLKSYKQLDTIRRRLHGYITESMFRRLVDNTNAVADNCNVTIPTGEHILPDYEIETHPLHKDGMRDGDELFEYIAKKGFKDKVKTKIKDKKELKKYKKRFDFELDFIKDKAKFSNYFLIVDDIIKMCEARGIERGGARGSVASSLVAYCIITDIDPLKFDLMFERFLNPTRVGGSYPDIDLDVSKTGRPIVKGYIEDKYGKNNVCTIGTYGTMKVKSLIRDAQRVFEGELPVDENKRVAFDVLDMNKLLKDLGDETKLEKAYENDLFKKYAKKFPYLVDFYFKRLEGQIRNLSKHAAGILITPTNISNWIPVRTQKLEDETNRVLVSQWKDSHCEKRGLIKFDVLGIKTLDVFKYAKKIIKKMDGVDIDFPRDVDLTDKKVIKKFDKGETDGVFQFNSEIQSAYLNELKVKSFEDLIVTNAILRPGPMDVDSHRKYIELTTGKRKPKYTHKLVKPYMKKTLGLYAFQEDVMRTANVLGKLTLAEADIMRTAMKKKDKDMMKQFGDKFVQGCIENGLTKKKAKKEWKKLEAFFAYGFNRCIHKSSMITLADGKQETILRLFNKHKAGQEIWLLSWDTETKKIVQHKIKEVVYSGRRSVGKLFLKDGNNLMLTTRHGVGTKRGFRLFSQLRKDDDVRCLIKMPNHFEMSISKIDSEKTYYEERYKEEVYDIVMEDNGPRNFFANGILVHNSHSVSYAFNGFICQWLKVYYPLPFWTATLEYAKDNPKDKENVWAFRNVIQQEGIEFEKPKATRCRHDFHISKEGKIVWPIRAIKGIGEKTAKVIAKACKENKPKTFAEFYEVIPRKSVNKRVVDKLIMADAFSEFGHPKKIAKEYYLELRKEKDIPEHFKVSKKDKKYWMEMKDETLGYLEEPYRKRYSHFFNKKITPISQLKNIRNGSPVIAGGKISRIYPYKTKRGMMYFINVFDADGQFLLLIFGGFDQKNKKVKKLKEGDIVEVLGVRSVSNRGELEVVLRDDRISQLEVLEDI